MEDNVFILILKNSSLILHMRRYIFVLFILIVLFEKINTVLNKNN